MYNVWPFPPAIHYLNRNLNTSNHFIIQIFITCYFLPVFLLTQSQKSSFFLELILPPFDFQSFKTVKNSSWLSLLSPALSNIMKMTSTSFSDRFTLSLVVESSFHLERQIIAALENCCFVNEFPALV